VVKNLFVQTVSRRHHETYLHHSPPLPLRRHAAAAQDFTINTFGSNITIHPDSSFVVRETIEVTFHRPRHGIYRDIPFKYRMTSAKIYNNTHKGVLRG